MSSKITDLQLRILKALKENIDNRGKPGYTIFSMDKFYWKLDFDIEKSDFQKQLDILESYGFIIQVNKCPGVDNFGDYTITVEGIEYLRQIEGK
ncbi:MAG: hypothetical protein ACTSSJ_07960 [Candidatus Odinarchaeia archaeon]